MTITHTFSKKEEIVNAITHGIGVILSIPALVILVVFAAMYGTASHVVSFTVFGASMLLLYICSTLLHSFPNGKVKNVFEILDHSSIYLFIAGTYTPILLTVVKGTIGWVLFGVVWGMAVFGIVFKSFFVKRFVIVSTLIYILMGWLIVFAFDRVVSVMPTAAITFLVAGGIFYTVGTLFYVKRLFRYHHAVWHSFVLAGSVLHFFAIMFTL
ncbi:MAG: hemolysin III family protein [Bacillaceae bacterium]|nr:hemolysin III family protein [Bacillaceae bacterium]